MTTKQFNSKGQRIEELDLPFLPFQKVEPNLPFEKVEPNIISPFQKVDMEQELLAWCEYYLHSKKKERNLSHIYFPTLSKGGNKL